MHYEIWAALIGVLLTAMALTQTFIDRFPVSSAMIYLLVGVAVSPLWLGLADFTITSSAGLIERGTEAVVLVSLFTSGLKLSAGLTDRTWLLPLRLATVAMVVTVACLALVGWRWLGMPLGGAILLGGILAPTDPVLAADVQVTGAGDRDRLRFSLTGEGGLNDGTSFPAVLIGLGLLGLHDLGEHGWRWLVIDIVWSLLGGVAVGSILGALVGRLVLHLRLKYEAAVGLDNFVSLGLVATAYGLAMLCHSSGFLAVFAAGFALRRTERRATAHLHDLPASSLKQAPPPVDANGSDAQAQAQSNPVVDDEDALPARVHEGAIAKDTAPAYLAHAVLTFNEQVERIGEAASVVIIGAVLWTIDAQNLVWWLVPLLFLLIRPLSVAVGMIGSDSLHGQRRLIAWFGIRGVGSIFYLAYALTHGVAPALGQQLTDITLLVVVSSIIIHGVSVTPLMSRYQRWITGRREQRAHRDD